jgi:hypothetical protein
VQLDLVDRRARRRCASSQGAQVLGAEVRHADGARPAVGEERLRAPVGLEGRSNAEGSAWWQDQQVDLLDAELAALFSNPCSVSS